MKNNILEFDDGEREGGGEKEEDSHEVNPDFSIGSMIYQNSPQVKIVKCIVHNIKMDISFNQSAGLSIMCLLEEVDKLIGKDHLFKRSVMLIKARCYYESRIFGAHHGLFSTYALETLGFYIINLFHSSLVGPLAVLHKLFAYYSTFEWDKYYLCIFTSKNFR